MPGIYRFGYFVATAMATQAVAQGIVKFAAERNGLAANGHKIELVASLENGGFISSNCAAALRQILRRYRNDIAHMNPPVAEINIEEIAKENLQDLALVEEMNRPGTYRHSEALNEGMKGGVMSSKRYPEEFKIER